MKFLLYGANGYTGKLVLEYAKQYNLVPVIAGRSEDKLKALAIDYKVDYIAFDLLDPKKINEQINDFDVLLNCAGPFSQTAKPLVKACLATGTHYMDITGEMAVFEWIKLRNSQALKTNICLIPGMGFDVVPTDCVASLLHQKMKDANKLILAFASVGGQLSHGTATTLVENLGTSSAIRKDGKIVAVPLGHKGKIVDFGEIALFAMTIPWGDISTAYSSTGIPNIEVYTFVPKRVFRMMKFQVLFNWILRMGWVKCIIQRKIDHSLIGPKKKTRYSTKSYVKGIVSNEKGEKISALLTAIDGYDFTAHASLLGVKKLMTEEFPSGYHTPSSIFGYEFARLIPGTKMEIIIKN